jgi:hypothetical protein
MAETGPPILNDVCLLNGSSSNNFIWLCLAAMSAATLAILLYKTMFLPE